MLNEKIFNSSFFIFNSRKAAFTLAEVLITLGVIGVVAAVTLPVLVRKYQEYVNINKIKVTYSLLSQALQLAINANGPVNEWNVTETKLNQKSAEQISSYIKPYLKIAKDCGVQEGCIRHDTDTYYLNGSLRYEAGKGFDTRAHYYKMILANGSYIWIRSVNATICNGNEGGYTNSCGAIFFDINGPKLPNVIGKDIFITYITPNNLRTNISGECTMTTSGWACLTYILLNNNMNYPK